MERLRLVDAPLREAEPRLRVGIVALVALRPGEPLARSVEVGELDPAQRRQGRELVAIGKILDEGKRLP